MNFLNTAFAVAALAMSCAAGIQAQEVSGYPVGYCNGEINTTSLVKHPDAGVWVSSAIYINPEYAATLAGNHIDSINAGICSAIHVDSLKVWVRQELDGANLAEGAIGDKDVKKGWNSIALKTPYNVPESTEDGFYIGFSILQDGRSAGPAVIRKGGIGTFYYQLGDAAWEDMSDQGTLCVEGMAYGDRLPKLNVEFVSVTTAPKFIMSEGTLEAVATVRNHGTLTVTGFDVVADIEGAAQSCTAMVACSIPFGQEQDVKFVISPELTSPDPETRQVTFTITGVNGGADENMSDNSAATSFDVVEKAFRRMAVIEEFTTERCPNCPVAAQKLHEVLQDPRYAGNAVAVCHHSGFHTDWLSIPSDVEYEWFYNANGTYAPAMMVDRAAMNGEGSAVFTIPSRSVIEERLDSRLALPTPLSVNVTVTENPDKTATVRVSGERVAEVPEDLMITVYIVENDVKARDQAGSGEGYKHQHVNRAVNATWGEPLVWNGDRYSYEYTVELNDVWNRSNMEAVAMVGQYSPDNALGCVVENAGRASFGASGIDGISSDSRTVIACYDAQGMLLPEPPINGFYIIVYSDGTSEKRLAGKHN